MHELNLCRTLLRQILEVADQHQALAVTLVHLKIGPLAGVEPELLKTAFTMAARGTIAQSAELSVTESQVQVYCHDCRDTYRVAPNRLCCPSCGSCSTQLASGDELVLQSVDLTLIDPSSADRTGSRPCV